MVIGAEDFPVFQTDEGDDRQQNNAARNVDQGAGPGVRRLAEECELWVV